jgi:hypothetical protein
MGVSLHLQNPDRESFIRNFGGELSIADEGDDEYAGLRTAYTF